MTVVGKCTQMCPESEVILRIENDLVHRLEKDEFGKPKCLIKEFRRSAAGQKNSPEDVRTSTVCLETCNFLIEK